MLGERARPTFGSPQLTHTVEHVRSFPDAKLRASPGRGWLRGCCGLNDIGIYNGAPNPIDRTAVPEDLWQQLQEELKPRNPQNPDELALPEWAVLVRSKPNFGIHRGGVLEGVDLSQSGSLQTTLSI